MEEKRRLERFDLEIPAKIELKSPDQKKEIFDLLTSNICSGGVFFNTDRPLSEGMQVKIDLILPLDKLKKMKDSSQQVFINVTGRVLRSESKGMAICFDKDYQIHPYSADPIVKH